MNFRSGPATGHSNYVTDKDDDNVAELGCHAFPNAESGANEPDSMTRSSIVPL